MISKPEKDQELKQNKKDFIKNRDLSKIVYTQVFDFNTKEEPEEKQLEMASLLFSDDFEKIKESYSYFSQYCSSLHIPTGSAIIKLQESLMSLYSQEDCDPFIFHCSRVILESIGSYTTDSFDGKLIISKIWNNLPDPFIFDVISSLINSKIENILFILSDSLSPTLFEMLKMPPNEENLQFLSGALKLLKIIIKSGDVPEITDDMKIMLFDIIKNTENQTILSQIFEMMSDICYDHPEYFLAPEICSGLFANHESYNSIILSSAAKALYSIIQILYDQKNDIKGMLEITEAIPMLLSAFQTQDSQAQIASLLSFFQIFSKIPDGAEIIYQCGILQMILEHKENVQHDVWVLCLRILCVVCVTLDDPEKMNFIENGFIQILIDNLSIDSDAMHFDILSAFASLLNLIIKQNQTDLFHQICDVDSIYEEIQNIYENTNNEQTQQLASIILDTITDS